MVQVSKQFKADFSVYVFFSMKNWMIVVIIEQTLKILFIFACTHSNSLGTNDGKENKVVYAKGKYEKCFINVCSVIIYTFFFSTSSFTTVHGILWIFNQTPDKGESFGGKVV